jgi:uncharacterized pyridoxamine 5'-phosphate oxidase family protein
MDLKKITDFLAECHVFYFATVEGDQPRVRPFGFYMVFEDKLYFGAGTQKATHRELEANPNVELCCCSKGKFLRIRGKAVLDMRPETEAALFEAMPMLKERYNAETGLVHSRFYLEDMSAILFSMDGTQEKLA